jgi:hypothetical protein
LREVLKNPQAHTNFLVEFVEKRRLVLKALPGAPVSLWQAYSDRADKFIAFARDQRTSAIEPIPVADVPAVATTEREHAIRNPGNASDVLSSERKIIVSIESIVTELAAWFNNEVTPGFERPVVEQAQFLIKHNLHEQYRRQTTATSRSEGFGLKWRDLDFSLDVVTFRQGFVSGRITRLKTEASRTEMTIPVAVKEALLDWKEDTP